MVVNFSNPLANASQFPTPDIFATPSFHLSDVNPLNRFILDAGELFFTRNGRGAIGIAGQALKNPERNVILIPAYHCPALVEPFIWLDYEIHFFPVQPDLSVDPDMLRKLIAKTSATHCVVIRYFGFSQNVEEIVQLLSETGLLIIEDCAHALFEFIRSVQRKDERVSATICSINKILPTIDGGALNLNHRQSSGLRQTSWDDEAKAIAYLMGIPQWIDSLKKKRQPAVATGTKATICAPPRTGFRYFSPEDISAGSYRHTKLILEKSNLERIKRRRRKIFEQLAKNINNPQVGSPLYTELGDSVPYVFPFLLEDERHFDTLRKQGIQILRWEELADSDCAISKGYRSRLIQLPCHQQLTDQQIDTMIDTINRLT